MRNVILLLLALTGQAAAQGSTSKCVSDPHYIGCLNPSTTFTRSSVLPMAQGDAPVAVSVAAILSKMVAADVTAALGFAPYSASNPSGYIGVSGAPVQSVFGRAGTVALLAADVTAALGYTPYSQANPAGYLTATALTPYAPLANPTFSGTVIIPAGASIAGFAPLASPTFTGMVIVPAGAAISGYAKLASPAFSGLMSSSGNLNLAAAGSTQTDATPITANGVFVSAVASGTGAKLPLSSTLAQGAFTYVTLWNNGANAMRLYPGSGDQILGNAQNVQIAVSSGGHVMCMYPGAGAAWACW